MGGCPKAWEPRGAADVWGRFAGRFASRAGQGAAEGAAAGWVHLPLDESCFWMHRPWLSSRKGGRQGPQVPDPGGQNSRRCRAQSRLRGHDAAVGTVENRSGGGEGSNAPLGLSMASWHGTQLRPGPTCRQQVPPQLMGMDVLHWSCLSAPLCPLHCPPADGAEGQNCLCCSGFSCGQGFLSSCN